MGKTIIYQDQELTQKILGAAIEVHKHCGPGLLESAYRFCLCVELDRLCIRYQQELNVPFFYKTKKVDCGFHADFLIEDKVVLELKALPTLLPIHKAQLLTYLRLLNRQVGLLINFNELILKTGIKRLCLKAKDVVVVEGSNLSSSAQGAFFS